MQDGYSLVEGALHFIEVSSFQTFGIASLELNSRSFKTPFNIPKSQKSQGIMFGKYGGCGNRETWCFSNFDATFDPLWHFELSICTQNVARWIQR
jgi:hypothetical protein